MIHLPSVTLFAIDCVNPTRVVDVFQRCTAHIRFADMVLLTDTKKHAKFPRAFNHGLDHLKIRVVHHEESDRKVTCPRPEHYPLPIDYEMASMREPSLHVNTSHMLYVEYDSGILNPWAWEDAWLAYDYCGACWPAHFEKGWDPCDGHTNNVGNGGFSLRSKRYSEATREMVDHFKNDPAIISSDMFPCRNGRTWLEAKGIRFATERIASRFSCENSIYSGQFGFHGRGTVELNGWGGHMKHLYPAVSTPPRPHRIQPAKPIKSIRRR